MVLVLVVLIMCLIVAWITGAIRDFFDGDDNKLSPAEYSLMTKVLVAAGILLSLATLKLGVMTKDARRRAASLARFDKKGA